MKLLFNYCDLRGFMDGAADVKLGVGWYKHHKDHKWWGFTLEFYLLFCYVNFTYVSDYKAYKKRMSYRFTDLLKEKE